MPVIEFEEVQIENDEREVTPNEQADDEFEFPLFAAPTSTAKEQSETRGRAPDPVMKVSLREQSEERINNERPESYYFAVYTDDERKSFQDAAITTDILLTYEPAVDATPWKCINLEEHNSKIRPKKKTRAGKKKRQAKIDGRQRREERERIQKKLDEEAQARLLKKKLHKRGGKKHKKKEEKEKEKPRFRTE